MGIKISGPLDRLNPETSIPKDVIEMRFMREALRLDAQLAMDPAAAVAKRYYDEKHRQVEFNVGDKVWLKLGKAYKVPGKQNRKTSPRREGPYEITRKVTPLAYELSIPPGTKIHPVISIDILIPILCLCTPAVVSMLPPAPPLFRTRLIAW
jgi:hypothetical protein